jgi:hypothetical protein
MFNLTNTKETHLSSNNTSLVAVKSTRSKDKQTDTTVSSAVMQGKESVLCSGQRTDCELDQTLGINCQSHKKL